jgi:hypothetical protein
VPSPGSATSPIPSGATARPSRSPRRGREQGKDGRYLLPLLVLSLSRLLWYGTFRAAAVRDRLTHLAR